MLKCFGVAVNNSEIFGTGQGGVDELAVKQAMSNVVGHGSRTWIHVSAGELSILRNVRPGVILLKGDNRGSQFTIQDLTPVFLS